jgi:hypothetical protein
VLENFIKTTGYHNAPTGAEHIKTKTVGDGRLVLNLPITTRVYTNQIFNLSDTRVYLDPLFSNLSAKENDDFPKAQVKEIVKPVSIQ